jgi:hypothetical protein
MKLTMAFLVVAAFATTAHADIMRWTFGNNNNLSNVSLGTYAQGPGSPSQANVSGSTVLDPTDNGSTGTRNTGINVFGNPSNPTSTNTYSFVGDGTSSFDFIFEMTPNTGWTYTSTQVQFQWATSGDGGVSYPYEFKNLTTNTVLDNGGSGLAGTGEALNQGQTATYSGDGAFTSTMQYRLRFTPANGETIHIAAITVSGFVRPAPEPSHVLAMVLMAGAAGYWVRTRLRSGEAVVA